MMDIQEGLWCKRGTCRRRLGQEEGDMKSDTHQRRSARMLPMQLTDAAPALAAFLSGLGEELRCPTG